MSTVRVATSDLSAYGSPQPSWSEISRMLEDGLAQGPGSGGPSRHTFWLATTSASGVPHLMPLGVQIQDGVWYFNASADTKKAQNLLREPSCALGVATESFDIVVRGEAHVLTDVKRLAVLYPPPRWEVREGAVHAEFSAPSAGPPPWKVFAFHPTTIYALGTAPPYGAARFDVSSSREQTDDI